MIERWRPVTSCLARAPANDWENAMTKSINDKFIVSVLGEQMGAFMWETICFREFRNDSKIIQSSRVCMGDEQVTSRWSNFSSE